MDTYTDHHGIWIRNPCPAELLSGNFYDVQVLETPLLTSLRFQMAPHHPSILLQYDDSKFVAGIRYKVREVIPAGFLSVVCSREWDAKHILESECYRLFDHPDTVIKATFIRPSLLTCYSDPLPGETPDFEIGVGDGNRKMMVRRYAAVAAFHGLYYPPDMQPGDLIQSLHPDALEAIGVRIGRLEGTFGVPDEFNPHDFTYGPFGGNRGNQ